MEYYRGILFLTTNRIGHMDLAIMSRVHIIIHYEPLSVQYKTKIWEDFFAKLEAEREDIYIEKRAKDFILEEDTMKATNWNGREIRNGSYLRLKIPYNIRRLLGANYLLNSLPNRRCSGGK